MQIGGIALWILAGMFGFGAGVGFVSSIAAAGKLMKPDRSDWWGPLFQVFFGLIGIIVLTPAAGIVAVALSFAVHYARGDALLPYPAGIGLVFLTWLAAWILWTICKPSSARGRGGNGAR